MNNYAVGCDMAAIVLTTTQANEVLAIVQAICTIVFLVAGFVLKFISWYKKSKEDGKIDKEEIKEIVDEAIDTADDINSEISKINKKE